MICYVLGHFYRKNGIKTSDFRDLLLEGAIFINRNLRLTTNDFIRMYMIIKCFLLV